MTLRARHIIPSAAGVLMALQGCASLPFGLPDEAPLREAVAAAAQPVPGVYTPPSSVADEAVGRSSAEIFADPAEPSSATVDWHAFFRDPELAAVIYAALENNQELNVLLQEIEVSKSEVLARQGAYLPFVTLGAGVGAEKPSLFTRDGAVEEGLEIRPGEAFPDPLPDFLLGAAFAWEVDIWKKLRNEKKAAVLRFLATREGRGFMVTNLVSEIAQSYFELMALDNKIKILQQTIAIQQDALEMVRIEKQAARVTELAVNRFKAEVARNQSRLYDLQQRVVVTENRLNLLAGRYPQAINRTSEGFETLALDAIRAGSPADLLGQRPDVRQAELELAAAELDVKAARASFYPRLDVSAAAGLQSFKVATLLTAPESLVYRVAAELMVPLINRSQIQAAYQGASAQQLAAVYRYQQTVLNAYVEVINQLAEIENINKSFELKSQQVAALSESINISSLLFRNARADYTEVLLTQRDALDARVELVELKQQQLQALVRAYRALGGGYVREGGGEAGDTDPTPAQAAAVP